MKFKKWIWIKIYGGYNCNPDLLIRTSGETKLLNYLLYIILWLFSNFT